MERLRKTYDDARSARGAEFRGTVERWLLSSAELLVLNRMAWGAGRKDWYLIRSLSDLDTVVVRAAPSDCLTVFAGQHLPNRGRAGNDLLRTALEVVADNEESVFGEIVRGEPELKDAFAAVPGDEEWVQEWIGDRLGRRIAFGAYPPVLSLDPNVAIDGIVPATDGSITIAAY
ncbi:MAG TPA: hypothetical protein VFH30_08070 [Acidimicrobiales bacterium]|nr:hypothetical protein [Acidimicrobiales bacterium]